MPPACTDEQKLDVKVEDGQTTIKLSQWVDGLGWCGQKTMELDAELLDELHMLVTSARLKIKREAAERECDDEILSARILEFPATV